MDMEAPMGWDELGDFTEAIHFMHTYVMKLVAAYIFDTKHAAEYTTFFVDMMSLGMVFCSAAYVVVQTVHAAVDFDRGYYFDYGSISDAANNLGRDEVIVAGLFIGWSLIMTLLGWWNSSRIWNLLTLRLEEAAEDSTGYETPLNWTKAIQLHTLLALVGIITVMVGYTLGDAVH